jgi:hypothetical protein
MRLNLPRHVRVNLIGILGCAALFIIIEMSAIPEGRTVAPGIFKVGYLANPRITESSGVVASRQHSGVFWTHNDGGGTKRQVLYGIDREGKSLADFNVAGVEIVDWEDIALDGAGHLYIGDIGNNYADREEIAVYEIDEPNPKSSQTAIHVNRSWKLRFPKHHLEESRLHHLKSFKQQERRDLPLFAGRHKGSRLARQGGTASH